MKNKTIKGHIVHTRSQKIFGWMAFVFLFICGIMVGIGLNSNQIKNTKNWGYNECNILQSEMLNRDSTAEKVKELRRLYAEYCAEEQKPVAAQKKEDTSSKETCEVIEEMQLRYLNDEKSFDKFEHEANIRIYENLFQYGCDENKQKYRDAISREMQIIAAMGGDVSAKSVCEQIEASLLTRLPEGDEYADSEIRIERAKIYANLSERGCAENSAKYVELAKQELEIARALEDDRFDNNDTVAVVETYKRLNMQAAAEEIFETAKKLTNPAIDFILEVEKIINEK